jgi:transposase-like protein
MLAIANALDGMSREQAARSADMDRRTLRDWVIRYNAHGVDGLKDHWGDGRPPKLSAQEKAELVAIVLAVPDPEGGISKEADTLGFMRLLNFSEKCRGSS